MISPFLRYPIMKQICRHIILAIALSVLPLCGYAQRYNPTDTLQNYFDYHINLETGVYSGLGKTHFYTQISPTFEYQATPKLKTFGGFSFVNDLNTTPIYVIRDFNERSYAPLRVSTQSAALRAGVVYQPNSQLTLAASAFFIGGHYDPLWNFSGAPLPLQAYGFSGEMSYRFNNNNTLHIYFDFIRDNAGTLLNPYLYDYLGGFGGYPLFPHQRPFSLDPMGYHPLF